MTIRPVTSVSGQVKAPPSKAETHRALFAGLLSKGRTVLYHPLVCDDTRATANATSSLGARVKFDDEFWTVESEGVPRPPDGSIECGEAGVTLRFAIPISSLTGSRVKLKGSDTLMRRPLRPLIEAMAQIGVTVEVEGHEVMIRPGATKGGRVRIAGNVSSQFISGLLLAGPLMENGLELSLTSPLESRGYVSLTVKTMNRHGIRVEVNRGMSLFRISRQTYHPAQHTIPGDYSSAAFAISAAAITGSKILISGLSQERSDPDSAFLDILSAMGAKAEFSREGLLVQGGSLIGRTVNVSDCPDLGPVIAVLGNYAEGQTTITGAARLRYKESDRLKAIRVELGRLGANIRETEEGLVVSGPTQLHPGTVDSHGDHRIAMALSVAALKAAGSVTIQDSQCVRKSYPNFFDDIRSIGVEAIER